MARESNQQHDESWSICPPGMLRQMMGEVRNSRRRAVTQRVTGILAVVCLLLAGGWLGAQVFVLSRPHDAQEFTALRCSEVHDLLVQYGHGALADKLRQRVAAHLRECPHCRAQHLRIQEEQIKKQTSWLAKKVPVKT